MQWLHSNIQCELPLITLANLSVHTNFCAFMQLLNKNKEMEKGEKADGTSTQ